MVVFLHPGSLAADTPTHNAATAQNFHFVKQYLARQILPSTNKISIKSIFTLPLQGIASRLFSPASPTASPESEYLSHGCVASRGVCKGAPHSIRVPSGQPYRRWRLRRRDVKVAVGFRRSGVCPSALQPAAQERSQASQQIPCRCRQQ